jgi:diguanylate cyclase (GGDEF)-like protein
MSGPCNTRYVIVIDPEKAINPTTDPGPEPQACGSEDTCRFLFQRMNHGLAYGRLWYEAGCPTDFQFLDANPAFFTQTGWREVRGKWLTEFLPLVRENHPEVLDSFSRVASGGEPEELETYLESLTTWFSISVYSPKPEHVVALFQDITARKRYEAQLEYMAHYDSLTDLPNRLLACSRAEHALARAKRRSSMVAILFLDLDGFKQVNDTHGHGEGDRVLREAARRLQARVRAEDTLARLGGDELVVVMESLTHEDEAAILAASLNEVMRMPFQVDGRELLITTSIGIALFPRDGQDTHTLFGHADAALYRAKQEGGDRHLFHMPGFEFHVSVPPSDDTDWAIERREVT